MFSSRAEPPPEEISLDLTPVPMPRRWIFKSRIPSSPRMATGGVIDGAVGDGDEPAAVFAFAAAEAKRNLVVVQQALLDRVADVVLQVQGGEVAPIGPG